MNNKPKKDKNIILLIKVLMSFDDIFIKMVNDILENGSFNFNEKARAKWEDGTKAQTIKKFGIINRYDLSKEFPIQTQRPVNFKMAIDEILWIWQKKSNKIEELNSKIWNRWAKNGNIGKAYGYQMSIKHKYNEGWFDQVDRIIYLLKNDSQSRRMITNIYVHNDLNEMNLYPCAFSVIFNVTNNRLNAILNQRSQDVLTANAWNVCQYAALIHMFSNISNLDPGELVHVISDAHIYDRHKEIIKELIKRPVYKTPKFIINKDIKDFYKFTLNDFKLENYNHGKQIKFEVAV